MVSEFDQRIWRLAVLALLMFAVFALASGCAQHARGQANDAPTGKQPNFVFILADDVGITDINAYSRELLQAEASEQFYKTPNLDSLARDGIAFEQAYATQLCSPTRAALLTGRFAPRLGFTTATPPTRTYFSAGLAAPADEMPLDTIEQKTKVDIMTPLESAHTQTALPTGHVLDRGRDVVTIAEALKGYRSVYLGKWHLGGHGAPGHQPSDNGFEELAWYDSGESRFFDWSKDWTRTRPHFDTSPVATAQLGDPGPAGTEAYLTDDLTARAVNFIDQQRKGSAPFLLYLAHFAVHTPIEAPSDTVAAFSSKPQIGWKGHRNPTYAAMLASLDKSVGKIRDALEARGLAENTYIVFMSDNGGVDWQVGPGARPLRIAPHASYQDDPPPTSNWPFRGGKATLYEGGVRVPLIILGPRAKGGHWVKRPVDMTDIFPTLYALAGFDPSQLYKDPTFDGRSLVPLLENRASPDYAKQAIIWHYPYNVIVPDPTDGLAGGPVSAIRKGRYKLVVRWRRDMQLFDIEADPFERNDLSGARAEISERLFAELEAWLRENVEPQYFPRTSTRYIPSQDPRGTALDGKDLIAEKEAQLAR